MNKLLPPIAVLLFFTGCVVGPNYKAPDTNVSQNYSESDNTDFSTAKPELNWWNSFDDPILSRLIDEAVKKNHDILIAEANIKAARAYQKQGDYDRYPTVTSGASIDKQERSKASIGNFPGISRDQTFFNAALDATWELDFFGRIKRSNEALNADYEAAVANQHSVTVSVTAEVALTYIELRGAQHRLDVAQNNANNQRDIYKLTQVIAAGGTGTELDVVRSSSQLESTLATLPLLQADIDVAIHRLSVLTGAEPGTLQAELSKPAQLPVFPTLVNIGQPADLLRRRPDIQSAERQLAAATARIGVETADLFPRVTLSGSFGFLGRSLADIGQSDYRTTSFGPFLTWPAFDLGRVRARIGAANANAEGLLANYQKTVLVALEETENNLVRVAKNRERQAHLQVAADAAQKAYDLSEVRYHNGVDSFINVLDAERQLLQIQDQLAQSEIDTGLALVALYKALGGGWEE